MEQYLQTTFYLDYRHPVIQKFVSRIINANDTDIEKAVKLYYAVRDEILYNPYDTITIKPMHRTSEIVKRGSGYCVQKANLLASVARAAGIPSRLGYADVKNHITIPKLLEYTKTDVFAFHGYTELFLNNKWVKCTPAFNKSLCEKSQVLPLEFNGVDDSIFHPFDLEGKRHMEYLNDYGTFPDFAYDEMIDVYKKYYPHFFEEGGYLQHELNFSGRYLKENAEGSALA